MSRFYLLPTTDIHLVLDEAIHDGQQFVLKFNYRGQISGFEPSKVSKCVEKPSIIDVDIDYDPNDTDKKMEIIVTAKEKGLSFIRIRYDLESQDDDGNPMFQECFVRVWVHEKIEKIWIGNNHITIHRGADFHGYVASVFARFNDSEDEDENDPCFEIGDIIPLLGLLSGFFSKYASNGLLCKLYSFPL